MPQAQPLPRWILVAAPLVAVGALLATFLVGGGDGDEPSPVPAYAADVDAVFDDVREPLLDLADVSGRWLDGPPP